MSFVLAILFFAGELLYFKTLSWKSALQPMTVAGGNFPATLSPEQSAEQKLCRDMPHQWHFRSHMHLLVQSDMHVVRPHVNFANDDHCDLCSHIDSVARCWLQLLHSLLNGRVSTQHALHASCIAMNSVQAVHSTAEWMKRAW